MLILKKLIENELREANNKFPEFQSRHEAYGVLKEELDDIGTGILIDYWQHCRNDKYNKYGNKDTNNLLDCLEAAVNCAMKELIQVGAMIQKAKFLEKTGGV